MEEQADRVTSDPKRRKKDPPGLVRAVHAIEERRADVLGIFGADRLVCDPIALLHFVSRIQDLGGQISSYRDGRDLDTLSDHGQLTTFLDGWFNRMRIKLIRTATKAGLARARARGQQLGRPRTAPPWRRWRSCAGQKLSFRQIGKRLGCSHATARSVWKKNPPPG